MALVFKIATLTIRTIAKPMASRFERAILNHPAARQRVISVAQVRHSFDDVMRFDDKNGVCKTLRARVHGLGMLNVCDPRSGFSNPLVQKTFRHSLSQLMHRLEVAITRGAEGRKGKVFVGDMTEEKAVELASRIVSEGFIYSVRRRRWDCIASCGAFACDRML